MHIKIVGLHATNAPRLRALLGAAHEVEALDAFPKDGPIRADVVISNSVNADEAARIECSLLQVPGAGSEQIASEALPAAIAVSNVHGHEVPIAEFTLHAVLEHFVQLWQYPARLDAQAWSEAYASRAQHDEAYGKTLAIVGFGHIGQEIARRAKALGMHVVAVTRSGKPTAPELADEFVPVSGLDAVLPRARALVLCCPLDENTRGLIPNFVTGSWQGLLAPANTPALVLDKLQDAIQRIVPKPEFAKHLQELGSEPSAMTRQQITQWMRSETQLWGKVVKDNNIKAE